jgi:hypothetical protein
MIYLNGWQRWRWGLRLEKGEEVRMILEREREREREDQFPGISKKWPLPLI